AGRLESAWVRIPGGSWLGIEPRATADAPWGWSDRLWHAAEPPPDAGWRGTPLTVFETLDWAHIDRIPTLAEPARLPSGGGTAVLNLIAALAVAQGAGALAYRGPYPTEQLFLALLESFRYEPAVRDPLAAFIGGGLAWRPAPRERLFVRNDLYVQRRERIEKVVWRGITYYRPDWQGVARHAPRRITDTPGGVRCELWVLEQPLEEHLRLGANGDLSEIVAAEPAPAASRPLPPDVWSGVVATVAARGRARAGDHGRGGDPARGRERLGRRAENDPDIEREERGHRDRRERHVTDPEPLFAPATDPAGPGEQPLHVRERVVLQHRDAKHVDEHVVAVHLDETERVQRQDQRLPLDDPGRG